MNSVLLSSLLIAMIGVAVATDLRARRIPNWVTFTGVAVALLVRALPGGPGIVDGILGCALGFGVGFLAYALRALRAGDGKLLAAAGAFLGPSLLGWTLFFTALSGGLLGLIALARRWGIRGSVLRMHALLTTARFGSLRTLDVRQAGAVTVPYGVAIGAGVLSALLFVA